MAPPVLHPQGNSEPARAAIPMRRMLAQANREAADATPAAARRQMAQWLTTIRYALSHPPLWQMVRDTLILVVEHLDALGRYTDAIEWLHTGITYSAARGDSATAAAFQIQLGRWLVYQGDFAEAHRLLEAGGHYFDRVGKEYPPALNANSHLAALQEQWEVGAALARRALAILPDTEVEERAQSYRNLGIIAHGQDDFDRALEHFQASLRLWQASAKPRYIAFGLVNVGSALRPLEKYAEAETVYQEAIAIFDRVDDPIHRAVAQANLGNVYLKQKKWEAAIDQYFAAEEVLSASNHRVRLGSLYTGWGMAYAGLKQHEYAIATYRHSIQIWTELEKPRARANDLDNLGLSLMKLGDYREAAATFRHALDDLADAPPDLPLRAEIVAHLAEAEAHLP